MSKQTKSEVTVSEWSYLVDDAEVEDKPLRLSISPDDTQRHELLKRLGVKEIPRLKVDFVLRRVNQIVYVTGALDAVIIQDCVVTLEPIETRIRDEFDAWFADPDKAVSLAKARRERQLQKGNNEMPMLDESEDPEPLRDGKVDLGELATQYLSLSINPYPHAEGVVFEVGDDKPAAVASEARKNPFAALKDWKDNLK
jgi:uncharacterized metal-binding protein YceD (DUF177 family)